MKHLTVAIKVGNVLRSLLQRIEVSHLPKGGCGLLCLWASEGYKATWEVQKLGLGLFGWGAVLGLWEHRDRPRAQPKDSPGSCNAGRIAHSTSRGSCSAP